jgi:hypothetical protein
MNSTKAELQRREEVISVAKLISQSNPKIDIAIWSDNHGVNIHLKRIFERFADIDESIILIEDDVSVDATALNYLSDNLTGLGTKAVVAHSSHSHSNTQLVYSRKTLFPRQWGLAITPEIMTTYIETLERKIIRRRLIKSSIEALYGDLLTRITLEKLTQWWFNHFYFCLKHGNWADAIVQYSVMAERGYYLVPSRSLVIDDSDFLDDRALTPRIPSDKQPVCDGFVSFSDLNQFQCSKCRLLDSHLGETNFRNLLAATKFRRYSMLRDYLKNSPRRDHL